MFPQPQPFWFSRPEKFRAQYAGIRNPLVDYCEAGIAINDPSYGLEYQMWRARIEGRNVLLGSERTGNGYHDEFPVFVANRMESVTLAFDNNMQPVICVKLLDEPTALLYWYDTPANAFTTTRYDNILEPFVRIDDNRAGSLSFNDAIFSYNRANQIMYRLQRDRYTVEYKFIDLHPWQKIYQCGMNIKFRFQYDIVWDTDKINRCDYASAINL